MKNYTFNDKLNYHMNRIKTLELKAKRAKLTDKEKADLTTSKGFSDGHDFTWFEFKSKIKIDNTYYLLEQKAKLKKFAPKDPDPYNTGFIRGKEGFRNELKNLGCEMFQDSKNNKR